MPIRCIGEVAQPALITHLLAMTEPDRPTADEPPDSEPVARAPRHSVFLSATVERFGGSAPSRHRVRDLSTGGVRIDQAANLQAGATVLVTVGALEAVGATVVWARDGVAGLEFARPIDPEAARAKAAVAPRPLSPRPNEAGPVPTAGWVPNLRNPYRK
jgi:hypothetical protein